MVVREGMREAVRMGMREAVRMGACDRMPGESVRGETSVEEREFERMFRRLMQQDLSAGTQGFRDALLERCIVALSAGTEGLPLTDEELGMLAAAGEPELATPEDRLECLDRLESTDRPRDWTGSPSSHPSV